MPAEDVIQRATEDVADGKPVDWDALAGRAQTDDERERLKCLRILGEIADLHRSGEDPIVGSAESLIASTVGASDARLDWTGEVWGRYRLLQKVGAGSFGSVYRAWDPELEREVAIKILHKSVADRRLKDRLLHEGRALAKIRHPNVVTVLGVESHEDRVGLGMEFVGGQTLEAVLRTHGALSAAEAVLVGEDVCRALLAVHHAGYVHRDIKARNVMRDAAGRIVLMDFGTGREADPQQMIARPEVVGTPLYMAPEVLAGEPPTACSDVYSVGVLLYHLVTCDYPVKGRNLDELRAAHAARRYESLKERRRDLPAAFVRVVEQALAHDPQVRLPTADALLHALGATAKGRAQAWAPAAPYLRAMLVAVVGSLFGTTALGLLNSSAYNLLLERSGFVTETMQDWFEWGAKSAVSPVAFAIGVVVAGALLRVMRRVAIGLFPRATAADASVRRRLAATARRLNLDDASVVGAWTLVLTAAILVSTWWYFWPLIAAITGGGSVSTVSTAPAGQLALLSPAYHEYYLWYRLVFSAVAIGFGAIWYVVVTFARAKDQTLNPWILAGGLAIVALSIATLDFPYRILQYNQADAVTWNGDDCYIIGERDDDLLLFCPRLQPPRNRVVKNNTTGLERTGIKESIFTAFSSNAAPRSPVRPSR